MNPALLGSILLWSVLFGSPGLILTQSGRSVTLAWDANSESDLAGYRVYYGAVSRTYGAPLDVPGTPAAPTFTVADLPAGTWYFAVTAYNAAGLESGFSNEVSTIIGQTSSACDLNQDQAENVLDLQLLVNSILSAGSAGDINGDGSVNVLDLQILINVILGTAVCP